MDEREILRRIKEDSEQIEVPEELQPKKVEKMLESIQQLQGEWEEKQPVSDKTIAFKKKKNGIYRYTRKIAAAAIVLVGACVLYAGSRMDNAIRNDADMDMSAISGVEEDAADNSTEEKISTVISAKKLGNMYKRAKSYGAIYDEAKKVQKQQKYVYRGAIAEDAGVESAVQDSTTSTGYSKTNLMTDGVDESDIVKTDGKYLYMVEENSVSITDIQNGAMKEVAAIEPPAGNFSSRILELYVDGPSLVVIAELEEAHLQQSQTNYVGNLVQELISVCGAYEMNTDTVTAAYCYDISNREKPEFIGEARQDGAYNTSRKIGDVLYLFTNDGLMLPSGSRKSALKEEKLDEWVPSVNEEVVAIDDIYVGEQGQNCLVMASFDVKKPEQKLDTKLVVGGYNDIYVSSSSIFLYQTDWSDSGNVYTQIAKFAMKQGAIQAVNAAAVMGNVRDTFAINEYQGYLRVLTTDDNRGTESNAVYVLDSDMRQVGSLTGIAPGECIYSARFMDNIGYFVTYRNMDPLFSVDFTNPKKPVLLGELKVTGFSEYLHFWGEDKLLGIGYETNPDTGEQLGIKLSMFDISNPAEVTEISKKVLWGVTYSPALYNYKSVLADAGKNLIGFAVDTDVTSVYEVYTYTDGQFVEKLSNTLRDAAGGYWDNIQNYRGLYADNTFYITNTDKLISYDMNDGWHKIEER